MANRIRNERLEIKLTEEEKARLRLNVEWYIFLQTYDCTAISSDGTCWLSAMFSNHTKIHNPRI